MSGEYNGIGAWWDRRKRGVWTGLGRRFRRLRRPERPTICLGCDFEGHHAGADGERFAESGTDRLLAILDAHSLRMTFNVVADLCETQPQRVERVRDAGHEIGCHGWRHESPRGLSGDETIAMLQKAMAAFERLKIVPSGFRSPRSAWTTTLVQYLPHYSIEWNAERDAAWRPYRIHDLMPRIAVKTDDWDLVDGTSDATALLVKWRGVVEEAKSRGGCVAIGLHEWIVGRDAAFADGLGAFIAELQADTSIRLAGIGDALRELW